MTQIDHTAGADDLSNLDRSIRGYIETLASIGIVLRQPKGRMATGPLSTKIGVLTAHDNIVEVARPVGLTLDQFWQLLLKAGQAWARYPKGWVYVPKKRVYVVAVFMNHSIELAS